MYFAKARSDRAIGGLISAIPKGHKLLILNLKFLGVKKIKAACALAKNSIAQKTNISQDFVVETLLWLSCSKQAGEAIKKCTAVDGEEFAFVLLDGGKKDAQALAKKMRVELIEEIGLKYENDDKIKREIEEMAVFRIMQ